jgi:hypothetical protein
MIQLVQQVATALLISTITTDLSAAEIAGVTVTPHVVAESMMYRQPRDADLAAKVQLFVKGAALPQKFNDQIPRELLASGDWAWHDLGTAVGRRTKPGGRGNTECPAVRANARAQE